MTKNKIKMADVAKAIKAMTVTGETVLFVDIDQVPVSWIECRKELPKGLLIVGVVGEPNIAAMTCIELEKILASKKIAEVSAGAVAQDGGSPSEALPRGGKAQGVGFMPVVCDTTMTRRANISFCRGCGTYDGNLGPCETWDCGSNERCSYCDHGLECHIAAGVSPRVMPEWSEARMREMADAEPGGLMACSPELLREMKEAAKTDGGVAQTLHLAGVELDREILVHWGLVENLEPKMEEINGGIEGGGAAGKDRRNPDAVQENNNGGETGAMGVGKPQVNMDLLRAIAAGNIPKDALEAVDCLSKEIEVDLCGFKSYNDVDGENYICGKEKHGPKIKHGEWIKI